MDDDASGRQLRNGEKSKKYGSPTWILAKIHKTNSRLLKNNGTSSQQSNNIYRRHSEYLYD